jgi:putative transcriptional regulator
MMETRLAPGLLLAMPQLVDPNFTRAVVLMVEHNDQGSFGLRVNQPIEVTAEELLESMGIDWNGDPDMLVWSGGPVQPNSGWILHDPDDLTPASAEPMSSEGTVLICPGVALSSSPDALRELASVPPDNLRLILGYSGWGPGQLASEMARGSWLHADADAELIFATPSEEMWEKALRSLGIDPEAIIQGFGIH